MPKRKHFFFRRASLRDASASKNGFTASLWSTHADTKDGQTRKGQSLLNPRADLKPVLINEKNMILIYSTHFHLVGKVEEVLGS